MPDQSLLESVTALPAIRAPKQRRSQKTITRILKAFDELLQQKPFDQITVAEVARRARASIPSIYARFDGKEALLLAAHEAFKEEIIAASSEFLAPQRWRDVAVPEICRRGAAELVRLYQTRQNLLRAVLLSDSPVIYERVALIARHLSERLAALLLPRLPLEDTRAAEEAIDFGVRATLALLQHQLVFGTVHPARFDLSRRQLVPRIAELLVAFIPAGERGAPSGGGPDLITPRKGGSRAQTPNTTGARE